MESVVVCVHPVMNVQIVQMDATALDHTDAVKCTPNQIKVSYYHIFAAIKQQMVWPLCTPDSTRWLFSTHQ